MALSFLAEPEPFDPAEDAEFAPPRAFVLGPALAARFAHVCALIGDAPCDALADLVVLFCEDIEEDGAVGTPSGEGPGRFPPAPSPSAGEHSSPRSGPLFSDDDAGGQP